MSITALPPPPQRGDAPELFAVRADALLGSLPQLVTEFNAATDQIDADIGVANAAAEAAQDAAASLSSAAANAQSSANAAQASATAAQASETYAHAWADQAQIWATWNTAFVVTSTATSKTLANREHCVVTAAGATITLPAAPPSGAEVAISVQAGVLDTVVARNGKTIMGVAENMTIDSQNVTVTMRLVNDDWRIV